MSKYSRSLYIQKNIFDTNDTMERCHKSDSKGKCYGIFPRIYLVFMLLCKALLLYPSAAYGQEPETPVFLLDEKPGDETDTRSTVAAMFPKWYGIVEKSVEKSDNTATAIECKTLIEELFQYYSQYRTESFTDIYDFIDLLRQDEIGNRFIEALKSDKKEIEITVKNRTAHVGRFIGIILWGDTIFGTPGTQKCQAEKNIPTIIFGPNNNCVLMGGDSFDFLFGGSSDDILRGDGDGLPDEYVVDVLVGGGGDDIYVFPKKGISLVYENNTLEAGNNSVRVGEGFNPADFQFRLLGGSLNITQNSSTGEFGSMIISNWTPRQPTKVSNKNIFDEYYDPRKVDEYPPIQKIEFFDGTALTVQDILNILNR